MAMSILLLALTWPVLRTTRHLRRRRPRRLTPSSPKERKDLSSASLASEPSTPEWNYSNKGAALPTRPSPRRDSGRRGGRFIRQLRGHLEHDVLRCLHG